MISDDDRWATIDRLFRDALDRPAAERAAFLRGACGDDERLYAEVRALLDAAAEADGWLEDGGHAILAGRAVDELTVDDRLEAGTRVGPYEIVQRLARGGMGHVYLAERADGRYEKRVALKVLRPDGVADDVLARFLAERRILPRSTTATLRGFSMPGAPPTAGRTSSWNTSRAGRSTGTVTRRA